MGHLSRSRPLRPEQGAAAVEFALISGLLFTLMFGMLQYGVYFLALQSGADAARSAAREAAVGMYDCADFDAFVQQSARGVASDFNATRTYYGAADTSLTSAVAGSDVEVGDIVRVTVRFHSHDFGFAFVPFIEDGLVEQSAVTRVETTTDDTVACT